MCILCLAYHHCSQTNTQEVRKKKEAEYEMLSNPVKGYAGKVMMMPVSVVRVHENCTVYYIILGLSDYLNSIHYRDSLILFMNKIVRRLPDYLNSKIL